MIDKSEVEKIAELAKLKFTEEEKEKMAEELSNILKYMEVLNDVNTDNIEIEEIISTNINMLREDEEVKFENVKEILDNAQKIDNMINVPSMNNQNN